MTESVRILTFQNGEVINPSWRYRLNAAVSGVTESYTVEWLIGTDEYAGNPLTWTSPANINVTNLNISITCMVIGADGSTVLCSQRITVYVRPTKIVFVTPTNNEYSTLTVYLDTWQSFVMWDTVSGFAEQTSQIETYNRADYSANVRHMTKYSDRVVSFNLIVQGETESAHNTALNRIIKACNTEHGADIDYYQSHLEIFVPELSRRVILFGYCTAGYPKINRLTLTASQVQLSFTCPDARFYLGGNTSVRNIPDTISVSNPSTSFTNEGDGWGIIANMAVDNGYETVHSSNSSVPDITNASGQSIAGCMIQTDWKTGQIKCTWNGTNAWHKVNPDCDVSKFRIAPGAQTITGLSYLYYYPTWRSINL